LAPFRVVVQTLTNRGPSMHRDFEMTAGR
jgi:hypothetical protein